MKKSLIFVSFALISGIALFTVQDTKSNAVSTQVEGVTQVKKHQNKTIAAAVSQFKNESLDSIEKSFPFSNKDTKVLAIKEDDGYGFLQGSAEHVDNNGKTVSTDNADTDPNAATVGEILSAIEKSRQQK